MIKDILLTEEDEIMMSDGDVAVGDAGEQVCDLLAGSAAGEWKQVPLCGWGLSSYRFAPLSELEALRPQIMEDLRRNNISAKVVITGKEISIRL